MISIKDIAKEAGVSKSTVSKVLNNRPRISKETRQRILDIIDKNNYQPNFFACQTSKRTKSNIIGLISQQYYGMEFTPYFPTLLTTIVTESKKCNKNVIVYLANNDDEIIKVLNQSSSPIDGAIFLNPTTNDKIISQLQKIEIPVVVIGTPDFALNSNISFCDVNTEETCEIFINHLIQHGFKKPVLITYATPITANNDRHVGYEKACAKYKLNPLIKKIEVRDTNLAKKIEELINDGVDSLILPSTSLVNEIKKVIDNKKLTIGQDIMVYSLGYGCENKDEIKNIKYAEADWEAIGKSSIDLLNQMLMGKKVSNSLVIKNKINN